MTTFTLFPHQGKCKFLRWVTVLTEGLTKMNLSCSHTYICTVMGVRVCCDRIPFISILEQRRLSTDYLYKLLALTFNPYTLAPGSINAVLYTLDPKSLTKSLKRFNISRNYYDIIDINPDCGICKQKYVLTKKH